MIKKITLLIFLLTAGFGHAQNLVITVTVPSGTTSCRMGGPWWGNWDPSVGPVGVNNGNDTFTFTFIPPPTANMEYLYTINGSGVYENLVDNAANAECTGRVDNGNIVTDYAAYANRVWKATDALKWNEIYDDCSEATLSNNEVNKLNFSLYPNPTVDSWTLKTQNIKMSSIQVFDILGKQVLSLTPNAIEAKIDASALKSALYFAKINTDSGSSSVKLVKQ